MAASAKSAGKSGKRTIEGDNKSPAFDDDEQMLALQEEEEEDDDEDDIKVLIKTMRKAQQLGNAR